MTNSPSDQDVELVFSSHPKFFLEAVSLYYPFPTEWMRKYSDILLWGGIANIDISCCAAMDDYSPGIMFNHSIQWDREARVLLFSNLVAKGHDLSVENILCDLEHRTDAAEYLESLGQAAPMSSGLRFLLDALRVAHGAPLRVEDVVENYARALHQHYLNEFSDIAGQRDVDDEEFARANPGYWKSRDKAACKLAAEERFAPTITSPLRLVDLAELISTNRMPPLMWNPALWRLTLAKMLKPALVETLLYELYCQHLKTRAPA